MTKKKVALGGGCHWCTEAVFQSLLGVIKVARVYVESIGDNSSFSEAVIVYFNSDEISVKTLIEIHLHTHKSTSNHSMRHKYRSAVYTFSEVQKQVGKSLQHFKSFQKEINNTGTYISKFKASRAEITNYYYKTKDSASFINPKLKLLLDQFSSAVNPEKLKHLK
jgi:peptide-methionine (S)-S-oxide reductase